ncbi:MAG: tetratricopeptide repeat protein [Limisphaerales bacterium]
MGRKKRRAFSNPSPNGPNQTRRPLEPTGAKRPTTLTPRLRGWRLWAVRAALVILAPTLLLAALELGLRLLGYGYPTRFYVRNASGTAWHDNDKFVWQFYSRNTELSPHPFLLPANKPAGTVRIFILGESAAVGTPDPSFGFGRILERMLRRQYPHTDIEVVNAAIRGINSHIILPIAKDCCDLAPDLFIAYLGNNEVVGLHAPGPDSVNLTPYLKLLRAIHWMKATRLGELAAAVVDRSGKTHADPDKQDAAFFRAHRLAADDSRREAVYQNFRINLEAICRVVRHSGASLLLSTVSVNLKDFPPFGSLHRADLTPEEKTRWEAAYEQGAAAESRGRYDQAIRDYLKALQLDDHFADLQFRLARCYLASGLDEKARQHYALARDWDAIQFRSDRRINAIIRQVAAENPAAGVSLVDAEQAFSNSPLSEHGIPGDNLFYEHVHLKFDGDYLLARTLYPAVVNLLKQKLGSPAAAGAPIPSRDECAAMLAFTPVNEAKLTASMIESTTQPPFTDQLEHDERLARARRSLIERFGKLNEQDLQRTLQVYQQAIAQAPDDWQLDYNLAGLYFGFRRYEAAVAPFQTASQLLPHYLPIRLGLSSALERTGRYDEATACLNEVLRLEPGYRPARDALAIVENDRQTGGADFKRP